VVDDTDLWRRTVDGDGGAFGTLFDRHRDRVFRHAVRWADTPADAEDITAASFLELWRRRDDVRLVDGLILPWLLVTTANIGRNIARGTRRYRDFLARLPREAASPDVADVVTQSLALGIDADLRRALSELRPVDLHLLVLIALEGYSYAEAATLLGIRPSAAKSQLHRTRTRLRERLRGQCNYDCLFGDGVLR
jgi:RNA polymerase sigma-70 factor (ECF subfamily)